MKRAETGNTKLAVAYIRVSTEEQKLGPEAQRAMIEEWANREDVSVVRWFVDQGVSGGSELSDRPSLIEALTELRAAGAGILVVAKRDRLARDVFVSLMIDRDVVALGGRVVSADGIANGVGAANNLLRVILDGFAAYEREVIGDRTREALGAKRARGERIGTVPFGFRLADDGARLIEDAEEQSTLQAARALRASGLSLRAVARELAIRGHLSRKGTPIAATRILKMTSAAPR